MANKKAAVLKEKFEMLKDKYIGDNSDSITRYTIVDKIIIPMILIDYDEGICMWEYMLKKYVNCCYPVDYSTLTDHVVENLDYDILIRVFESNETIRKHVFRLDPYQSHLWCTWFLRDLVIDEKFELADTLINLYLQNTNGDNNVQNNLFEFLYQTVSNQES